MLERLFKSKTTVRLLGLLLFGKPLHIREIARRIDITPIYVKKELENLERLGLVSSAKVGNLSVWEINKLSPIYKEMKDIFLKTESLGGYLQEVFKKTSVEFALIYGSFAKGTENEKSDIDLLIVGEIKQSVLINTISGIERKISREINYIVWTKEEFLKNAKKKHHLLINIIKNPVIMIKGDENEFRKFVE
ncbi:MAG: nucleotidyltransferase domain-containing protein [Candidatus Micrarchaeota archaeon]